MSHVRFVYFQQFASLIQSFAWKMYIFYFWLSYGIPSIILIVFFIILFGKHKQFNFSFYRLLQCDLVLNILVYISTWIGRFSTQEETREFMVYILKNYNFVFIIAVFVSLGFFHAQSVSTILLCTHRYTMARFSMANQFWNHHFFKVFIGGMLYCGIIMIPLYFIGAVPPKYYNEKTGKIESLIESKAQSKAIYRSITFLSALYFFLIFFIGIMALWEVKKRFSGTYSSPQTKAMTKQMTIIVIVNTCVYLTVIIFQFLGPSYIWRLPWDQQDAIMMMVSDVLSLSMPYILLIFDRNVKTTILKNVKTSMYTTNSSMVDVAAGRPKKSATMNN